MYAIYFAFSYACSAKRLNWQHRQTDLIGEGSLSLMQMHYAEIRFVEYHVGVDVERTAEDATCYTYFFGRYSPKLHNVDNR